MNIESRSPIPDHRCTPCFWATQCSGTRHRSTPLGKPSSGWHDPSSLTCRPAQMRVDGQTTCSSSPSQVLFSSQIPSHRIRRCGECYLPQPRICLLRRLPGELDHGHWRKDACAACHLIHGRYHRRCLSYRAKTSDNQSPTRPERGSIGCVRACSSTRLPETPREESHCRDPTAAPARTPLVLPGRVPG